MSSLNFAVRAWCTARSISAVVVSSTNSEKVNGSGEKFCQSASHRECHCIDTVCNKGYD